MQIHKIKKIANAFSYILCGFGIIEIFFSKHFNHIENTILIFCLATSFCIVVILESYIFIKKKKNER